MDDRHYESDQSDELDVVIDIREGIQITVTSTNSPDREPYTIVDHQSLNVESAGKPDRAKLYMSDKEVDASIYTQDMAAETSNCSVEDACTQYEHQVMSSELLQRTLMSQKFERFINTAVPIMMEEIRHNIILEKIMW